jgi:hypothetical protein
MIGRRAFLDRAHPSLGRLTGELMLTNQFDPESHASFDTE